MRTFVSSVRWLSGLSLALSISAGVQGCGSDSDTEVPIATTDGGDASDVSIDGAGGTGGKDGGGGGDSSAGKGGGGASGGTGGATAGSGGASAGSGGATAGSGGATAGSGGTGPQCLLNGATCVAHADCCTANCDPQTHFCANPPGVCKQPGEACSGATECCSTICTGGLCGNGTCVSDGQPCTASDTCCSGKCGPAPEGGVQTCLPLNPECKTTGNDCTQATECCSKFCVNGRCSAQPSFCTQVGEACLTDYECCTGICTKQVGEPLGLCTMPTAPGSTGCLPAGIVCAGGAISDAGGIPQCGGDCCSRSCAPYGPTGVLVCQPPSGCRPTGEICTQDSDCCGAPGSIDGNKSNVHCSKTPGEPVGRCDNGNSCRAAGAICKLESSSCNAENNCCAGNVNQDPTVCQQDLLGIPRCTGVGDCSEAGSKQGLPCATSADCCGLSCVPNKEPDAGAPFICGQNTCVPAGGACTTDADCCPGLPCVAPPGSTQGVCGATTNPDAGVPESGIPETGVPEAGTDAPLPDVVVVDTAPPCALYGQTCTTATDCCNGVPCTQGRCLFPVF